MYWMRCGPQMEERMRTAGLLGICLVLWAGTGFASTIVVVNSSFETLGTGGLTNACGANCSFSANVPVPGWTATGSGSFGQIQPGTQLGNFTMFNSLSNGITNLFVDNETVSQTVGPTVQLGGQYTLQVDVGLRNDMTTVGQTDTIDLMIGSTAYQATGPALTSGHWTTFTATYTGQLADVGDPIGISLIQFGPNGPTQGEFDNVQLSVVVPEPTTFPLFALGWAGLAFVARRRRSGRVPRQV